MSTPSLADSAVDAIAAVRAMGADMPADAPERHTVRNLKRMAEEIIGNALRHARDLAYQAESLSKDMRDAEHATAQKVLGNG